MFALARRKNVFFSLRLSSRSLPFFLSLSPSLFYNAASSTIFYSLSLAARYTIALSAPDIFVSQFSSRVVIAERSIWPIIWPRLCL